MEFSLALNVGTGRLTNDLRNHKYFIFIDRYALFSTGLFIKLKLKLCVCLMNKMNNWRRRFGVLEYGTLNLMLEPDSTSAKKEFDTLGQIQKETIEQTLKPLLSAVIHSNFWTI